MSSWSVGKYINFAIEIAMPSSPFAFIYCIKMVGLVSGTRGYIRDFFVRIKVTRKL